MVYLLWNCIEFLNNDLAWRTLKLPKVPSFHDVFPRLDVSNNTSDDSNYSTIKFSLRSLFHIRLRLTNLFMALTNCLLIDDLTSLLPTDGKEFQISVLFWHMWSMSQNQCFWHFIEDWKRCLTKPRALY